jgi:hypothetical protein
MRTANAGSRGEFFDVMDRPVGQTWQHIGQVVTNRDIETTPFPRYSRLTSLLKGPIMEMSR